MHPRWIPGHGQGPEPPRQAWPGQDGKTQHQDLVERHNPILEGSGGRPRVVNTPRPPAHGREQPKGPAANLSRRAIACRSNLPFHSVKRYSA